MLNHSLTRCGHVRDTQIEKVTRRWRLSMQREATKTVFKLMMSVVFLISHFIVPQSHEQDILIKILVSGDHYFQVSFMKVNFKKNFKYRGQAPKIKVF